MYLSFGWSFANNSHCDVNRAGSELYIVCMYVRYMMYAQYKVMYTVNTVCGKCSIHRSCAVYTKIYCIKYTKYCRALYTKLHTYTTYTYIPSSCLIGEGIAGFLMINSIRPSTAPLLIIGFAISRATCSGWTYTRMYVGVVWDIWVMKAYNMSIYYVSM